MSEIERQEDEGAKAFDARLARRLLTYLRPYRARASFSVFLVILSSILQLAGPAIIAIAIDLYVRPTGVAPATSVSARVGEWLSNQGLAFSQLEGINFAATLYVITLLGGFAVLYVQMVLMNLMGQYVMYDLRKQIFSKLQKLDVQYFDRNPVGRLITRVTTDVDALNEMFTAGFVAIFGDIFVLIGIVGVLFWMNWKMALVLFSITPFILMVSLWFRRGARRTYRQVRARIAAINAFLQEHISGMSVVQIFNREEKEAAKFEVLNARHRDANIDSIFYYAVFYPVIELIESVGIALIVWYGGGQVIQGALSLGALIAFFQYAQRFYEPISDLSEKYNILQAAMAASERIFKLIDTDAKIVDGPDAIDIKDVETIEFRNVSFAYNENEWVLKNVSFKVKKGERIALVGHTGAGKTTVTSLLLRFYDVQEGAVLVNGIDVKNIRLESLRRLFAVVQQDLFLFSGTVGENISLGDRAIPDERIRAAAARVQADRFITRLPGEFTAAVKERGAGFSVGEKQLLSFARALAFDPPVLILDEATSSIDTETEALIQQGIEVLMAGRTAVVIAHRLSTIRAADQILVFHHGEIRESGTHEELLERNGIYRRLHDLQQKSLEVEREEAVSS